MAAIDVKTFYPSAPALSDPSASQSSKSKNYLNSEVSRMQIGSPLVDAEAASLKPVLGPLVLQAGKVGVALAGKTEIVSPADQLVSGKNGSAGSCDFRFCFSVYCCARRVCYI